MRGERKPNLVPRAFSLDVMEGNSTHEEWPEAPVSPLKVSKRKALARRLKGTSRLSSVIFMINHDPFFKRIENDLNIHRTIDRHVNLNTE